MIELERGRTARGVSNYGFDSGEKDKGEMDKNKKTLTSQNTARLLGRTVH